MRIPALVSIINCFIIIVLGVYIYSQDTKNWINKSFAFFCAVLGLWAFTEFMYRNASTLKTADLWVRMTAFAWPFTTPAFIIFTLFFIGSKISKSKIFYVVLFVPTILITIVDFSTRLLTAGAIKVYWGYATFPSDNVIYVLLSDLWAVAVAIASIILLVNFYLKTTNPIKKRQTVYIITGFCFPFIAGVTTEIILPVFFKIRIPEMLTVSFVGLVLIITYAMSKFELFAISPERAANNIITTMTDSLILMDPEGKVLMVNKSTMDLLGFTKEELIGKSAKLLFAEKKLFPNYFKDRNWTVKNYETKYQTKEGKAVPIIFSTSVIRDKKGDIAGVVGVANNITERNIANTLQEALLQVPEKIRGIKFGYLYRSATEAAKVGGDFYDIFELGRNKVGILVGDISGKGIEAATLTSLVKNTIRAYSFQGESPSKVMERSNNVIKQSSSPRTFVTVFYGVLNTETGELVYCSAGHPMAMLKKGISEVNVLKTSSTVIGVFPDQKYFNDFTEIGKDDCLVLYTDGVTEARRDKDFFGEKRLGKVIYELKTSTENYPISIFNKVLDYSQGKLTDDLVLLSISLDEAVKKKQAKAG